MLASDWGRAVVIALCALAPSAALAQIKPIRPVAPALAPHTTAVTVAAARQQGSVLAGGVAWVCHGDTCTTSTLLHPPLEPSCEALVREVGALKSLAFSGGSLGAAEIGACNAAVARAPAGTARVQPAIAPPSLHAGLSVPPLQPGTTQSAMPALQGSNIPPAGGIGIARTPSLPSHGNAPPSGGIGIARAPAETAAAKAPPPPPLAFETQQSLKLIFPASGPLSILVPTLRLAFPHR